MWRALALAGLVGLAGCGGGGDSSLTVSAAASLKRPLTAYGADVGRVRLSFAGSDQLAAQIRAGIRPDVFAAADTKLPAGLFAAGLVERPTVFARNCLVIAVPPGSRRVRSIADLARAGVTLALGSPSVPVGAYARAVLARLAPAKRARILANVRSNEPDVSGIVGKLTQGSVDAGFLYATDVPPARLQAIALPAALEPQVAYAAAVVTGTPRRDRAVAFVRGLVAGDGRRRLAAAGFLPAP